MKSKKVKTKVKKKTKGQLIAEADKLFSLYIRISSADWRGYGKCYTCGKIEHYKKLQCGHFISRSSHNLRFDERNVRTQCVSCNVFKNGNYIEYTTRLQKERGYEFVEQLKKDGKKNKQFTVAELEDIITTYKKKVKEYDRD